MYRKAAEQGLAKAQYNLGFMYSTGEGVPEDYATAYSWWKIAIANGNSLPKKGIPTLEKKMTPEQIAKAEELYKEMIKKNPKLINK